MARISGVDLPREKRVEIGLTYVYGIGRVSATKILEAAKVNPDTRVRDLTDDEVKRISEVIDADYMVEGDLRREIAMNIKRLQEIGCSREEFEKLLEKRMGASYRAPGTAEADESTEQAESDMDVRSGSGQVPAADAAASRLAESGKVRTGSTEKKPLKEKPAQKEAEDAKTQQGVQEDDTELTVEDLD